jgi:hypothetical protein
MSNPVRSRFCAVTAPFWMINHAARSCVWGSGGSWLRVGRGWTGDENMIGPFRNSSRVPPTSLAGLKSRGDQCLRLRGLTRWTKKYEKLSSSKAHTFFTLFLTRLCSCYTLHREDRVWTVNCFVLYEAVSNFTILMGIRGLDIGSWYIGL